MRSHVFNVFAGLLGLMMVVTNVGCAEMTRRYQAAVGARVSSIRSLRIQFVGGGIFFVVLSVLTW